MKQIIITFFYLGVLFILFLIHIFVFPFKKRLSKKKLFREGFLDKFIDIDYTPPEDSINDQQKTIVNVNILKDAVVSMNDQIEQMKTDISNLQDQVTTLTNQQSDLASSATPDIEGTSL
jgi:hypothetical protein